MEKRDFIRRHQSQLDVLNIPYPLREALGEQLRSIFQADKNDENEFDREHALTASAKNLRSALPNNTGPYGSMIVIPHICTWDIREDPNRGMWNALSKLPVPVLKAIAKGMLELERVDDGEGDADDLPSGKQSLLNQICNPKAWTRVILFNQTRDGSGRVFAALPSPPYLPHVEFASEEESAAKEADVTGPFPFQYHMTKTKTIQCSLGYLSPEATGTGLPTMDLVPLYTVPNTLTRSVRYVALLEQDAPSFALEHVKEYYANFVRRMHLARQDALQVQEETKEAQQREELKQQPRHTGKVHKVYTDTNDPMELSHPVAGLDPSKFELTSSLSDADIIFSYQSIFAPNNPIRRYLDDNPSAAKRVLINQFPYEGAFVQKDHLGREILKQYGLPRPLWSMETYDLDVQLGEFVGSAILALEQSDQTEDKCGNKRPTWIIKPARGTQSKGHVVTTSISQVLRLVDAGGESRVAQRYIENPVCYNGRKVDSRCLVMMTSADPPGNPTLFMHNRFFFRIAGKAHKISTPQDLMDHEAVLTAMHLVDQNEGRNKAKLTAAADDVLPSAESRLLLPVDHKTIAKLEEDYNTVGFDWENSILPKIQTLIRELFNGMTRAYPAMAGSRTSRALYGVDIMFEICTEGGVEPKLTEVTFCPANNAICEAYERDEDLFRSYASDVFSCLFLGEVSKNVTQLQ